MKKLFFVFVVSLAALASQAQYEKDDDGEKKGFKKENLFAGGSVTASFYSGGTVLGVSPYFGYSLNKFVDVAASVNFNYTSQRDNIVYGDKIRQTVWGPGAFVRLFPVRFLFAHAQFEHNYIRQKYLAVPNSGYQDDIYKFDANSILVGGGYCSGREGTGDIFYYFSILWDVKKDPNSPYVDGLARAVPIVKAGLQVPLFQPSVRVNGHKRRY